VLTLLWAVTCELGIPRSTLREHLDREGVDYQTHRRVRNTPLQKPRVLLYSLEEGRWSEERSIPDMEGGIGSYLFPRTAYFLSLHSNDLGLQ
jgi:hypothetical protein